MPSADGFESACAALGAEHRTDAWTRALCQAALERWRQAPHGDLPRWRAALAALPDTPTQADTGRPAPRLGAPVTEPGALRSLLMEWHPWRKGPLELGGVFIDTEWRSNRKWDRLAPHLVNPPDTEDGGAGRAGIEGERILDVGCGNGYFGWRLLAAGAREVVGIDPTWVYVMQWLVCRHFAGSTPNYVLPLGIEDLPAGAANFDTVLSMGVLYHRRDPLEHLSQLRALLRPGGRLVLETLVLPPSQADEILEPRPRYARMRNVWAIPGTARLLRWAGLAGFRGARVVDVTPTTPDEQRSTDWMQFESLADALDALPGATADEDNGAGRTVEGHPAPIRAIVIARRD